MYVCLGNESRLSVAALELLHHQHNWQGSSGGGPDQSWTVMSSGAGTDDLQVAGVHQVVATRSTSLLSVPVSVRAGD